MKKKQGRLIVISGPSGVGKTTLLKMLLKKHEDKICFSVSSTSRKPRNGEVEGQDYNFISTSDFRKGINKDTFLEFALVHDNYYGTLKEQVKNILKSGKHCLLDIDVQGGSNLMSRGVKATYIFIAPPSIESLKKRLLTRSTDSIEVINKRVKTAINEIKQKKQYENIIVNNDLQKAYNKLEEIVLKNGGNV